MIGRSSSPCHPPLVLIQDREGRVESLSILDRGGRYREWPPQPLGVIEGWLRDRAVGMDIIDDAWGSFLDANGVWEPQTISFNLWLHDDLLFEAKMRWS